VYTAKSVGLLALGTRPMGLPIAIQYQLPVGGRDEKKLLGLCLALQGHQIPFHHPDKVFLGVPITATLNYKVYYEGIITKLREQNWTD
jgi:hypothetical protein